MRVMKMPRNSRGRGGDSLILRDHLDPQEERLSVILSAIRRIREETESSLLYRLMLLPNQKFNLLMILVAMKATYLMKGKEVDILKSYFPGGGLTLTQLAKIMDLSPPTVKEYLEDLMRRGLVRREGVRKGARYYPKEEIVLIMLSEKPDILGKVDLKPLVRFYQRLILTSLTKNPKF